MMLAVWRRSSGRVPLRIELDGPADTPTVLCTSVTKLRPFKGRSCTDCAAITVETVDESVWRAGLCASTCTTSVTLPTCNCMSARARSPAETVRLIDAFLKLGASPVIVYGPGATRLKM